MCRFKKDDDSYDITIINESPDPLNDDLRMQEMLDE